MTDDGLLLLYFVRKAYLQQNLGIKTHSIFSLKSEPVKAESLANVIFLLRITQNIRFCDRIKLLALNTATNYFYLIAPFFWKTQYRYFIGPKNYFFKLQRLIKIRQDPTEKWMYDNLINLPVFFFCRSLRARSTLPGYWSSYLQPYQNIYMSK